MVPELVSAAPAVAAPLMVPALVRLPEAWAEPARVVMVPLLVRFPTVLRTSVRPAPLMVTPLSTKAPVTPPNSSVAEGEVKFSATLTSSLLANRSVPAVTCVARLAALRFVSPPAPMKSVPALWRCNTTVPAAPASSAAAMLMVSARSVMTWPMAVMLPAADWFRLPAVAVRFTAPPVLLTPAWTFSPLPAVIITAPALPATAPPSVIMPPAFIATPAPETSAPVVMLPPGAVSVRAPATVMPALTVMLPASAISVRPPVGLVTAESTVRFACAWSVTRPAKPAMVEGRISTVSPSALSVTKVKAGAVPDAVPPAG